MLGVIFIRKSKATHHHHYNHLSTRVPRLPWTPSLILTTTSPPPLPPSTTNLSSFQFKTIQIKEQKHELNNMN